RELFEGDHPLLTRGFDPMTVRFFMLQSHYSSTLDFSNEALSAAEKGYKKLSQGMKNLQALSPAFSASPDEVLNKTLVQLVDQLHQAMSDDFNTARALAVMFEMTARINDFTNKNADPETISSETWNEFKANYVAFFNEVMGLKQEAGNQDGKLDQAMEVLIDLRQKAKEARDYKKSDEIRDRLKDHGIMLKDGKEGTTFTVET
ncbi:MAG: cysteine--tRNA ligase, partial [Cyclobacteriaceae bacterium]|nr:cysteine--tRNA ligase [Cyclobacteriaceae bacterium]